MMKKPRTMKDLEEKLRALLEGLETQQIDKLMAEGKVGDFRNYGIAYLNAVKEKVDSSVREAVHQALDEAAEVATTRTIETGKGKNKWGGRDYSIKTIVDKKSILKLKEKY